MQRASRWRRRTVPQALASLWLLGALGLDTGAWAGTPAPAVSEIADAGGSFRCARLRPAGNQVVIVDTTLAGVPAIVRVPRRVARPPIVLWHGFGPPGSERALMDALPLDEVPAVKVYLGLPLFGRRAPPGGERELARRQSRDFAISLFRPVVVGAAGELPAVVAALERHGCMAAGQRIGLFGFSGGGAAALMALIEGRVAVNAAVLVNASTGLNASVDALQRVLKTRYAWTPRARALARKTDAVRHAADIARGFPPPAVLLVQGEADAVLTPRPARALHDALLPLYRKSHNAARLRLDRIPGMPHGWSADATAAARVRQVTADWFLRHG